MNNHLFSYDQAVDIVIEYLNSIENIKEFCDTNNLGYKNVIYFKNNPYKKEFPNLICKILVIFGNDVSVKKYFEITQKK